MGIVISVIFIMLSIATGVGVFIYIKTQDNKTMSTIKNKNKKEEDIPLKGINIVKQKFGIDDISNGIITLENYKKRAIILKIKNSDFNMLSEEGQGVVEDVLRQIALSVNYDVAFFSTTRAVDTSLPMLKAREVLNKTENNKIQEYIVNYMNTFDAIMSQERIMQREDYIIITYTGDMKNSEKELERRAIFFVNSLKKINTEATMLNTDEIVDILYHCLNRNSYFSPSKSIKLGALDLYVGKRKKGE